MKNQRRIDATELLEFATAVYENAGMPEADARLAADTLVQADLWGHQSHGVMRLSWYLGRLKAGVCAPAASPELVVDAGAIAVMVALSTAIRFVQESRSHDAAEALRAMVTNTSAVIRRQPDVTGPALPREVAQRDLVPGDLVAL